MDFLSPGTKKSGLCLQVAVSGGSTVQYINFEVPTYSSTYTVIVRMKYVQPNLFCFLESFKAQKFGILFIYTYIYIFFLGGGGWVGEEG